MEGTAVRKLLTSTSKSDKRHTAGTVNKLIADVARLRLALETVMPGVLMSQPANKKGTTAATAWRTEAFTFTFRGKLTSAAAQEKALTATTHDIAASKQAIYVLTVQTDGTTFTITKGADSTIGTDVWPTAPDNEIIVAYMKITTGAGGIFDASTDNLAVAGNIAAITFTDASAVGAALLTAARLLNLDGSEVDPTS